MNLLRPDEWVGVWSVDRRFEFETPGAPERFRGQATVSPARPGLHLYAEEGFLEGLPKPVHAVQRYWIRNPSPDTLELLFAPDPDRPETARPFVTLAADGTGALAGRHICEADRYDGTYRSASPDSIEIVWRIEGPRKRGRILTTLTRTKDEMGYA
jgi:hypothetical protein